MMSVQVVSNIPQLPSRGPEGPAACGREADESIRDVVGDLRRWNRNKGGTLLDELISNLRFPPGTSPARTLATLAQALRDRATAAGEHKNLTNAELLAFRLLAQSPSGLDRDLGWSDAPPPPRVGEGDEVAGARRRYEAKYNAWDWKGERNGSVAGVVADALRRYQTDGQAERVVQDWSKWLSTVAAAAADTPVPEPKRVYWWGEVDASQLDPGEIQGIGNLSP
eukprot:Hpha_TRINITY_DN25185_c0_g1::TRINITY_DN25185_c0_g1_i1::g.139327::m.139327